MENYVLPVLSGVIVCNAILSVAIPTSFQYYSKDLKLAINFNIIIIFAKKRVSNSVICPNYPPKIIHTLLMTEAFENKLFKYLRKNIE